MSDYLPQKAPAKLTPEELLEKEREFQQGIKKLDNSPVKTVPDFQERLVKDIPRQRINTKEILPQVTGDQFKKNMAEKLAKTAALRNIGKKAMGILPFAGAAYGLMSGDPAMAADQAAGDVPFLGQAYEAIKPENAGNPEEERQMIAERNANVNYQNSPAHLARMNALKNFGR